MLLQLSFHMELLEVSYLWPEILKSFYAQYDTEILDQSFELPQRITLHVTQASLGQRAKFQVLCWLENGRLTLARIYFNCTLDYTFDKLAIFGAKLPHI